MSASLTDKIVLHALGTNAREYGALSVPYGRLLVHWQFRHSRRVLLVQWIATGDRLCIHPSNAVSARVLSGGGRCQPAWAVVGALVRKGTPFVGDRVRARELIRSDRSGADSEKPVRGAQLVHTVAQLCGV